MSTKVLLKVSTPLGPDTLVLDRFEGDELISEPFCFSLDMVSKSTSLDLSALVGKVATVTLDMYGTKRYYSGIVGEARQGVTNYQENPRITVYTAFIYPKYWLLKFTRDNLIFQNKSALDIIKLVLNENGVTDLEDKVTSSGKAEREYCVQYGESAFDFCSRLMEEEGIFYFFKHADGVHTMVLADNSTIALPALGQDITLTGLGSGAPLLNQIQAFSLQEQVVVKKFAAADYNFKTASTKLYNKVAGQGEGGEVYEYPAIYKASGEGDTLTGHRIKEYEWMKKTVSGEGTTSLFCPMFSFKLARHPRSDANRSYILYRVHHLINRRAVRDEGFHYQNEFEAFPDDVPFRPIRVTPKARIHSTQTAKVTTKAGEEIWCDEYGRIKVKFHWDQRGPDDEKSSCWIRVAQLWASSGWGGLFTPRKGMEVVVTFLEGDPDRPLITGCVYNSDHMPPYARSEPTKSTIRSDTTKGGGGFNEFRFEDKKGSEQIYIHAQKDHDTYVIHSRTLIIETGDDTSTIQQGKRTVTLEAQQGGPGDDTLTLFKGDRTVHLKQGNHALTIDQGNSTITLQNGDETTDITGNRNVKVSKDKLVEVTGKLTIKVTGDIEIKSSANVKVEAASSMEIKSGGAMKITAGGTLDIKGGGPVTIKGPVVKVN